MRQERVVLKDPTYTQGAQWHTNSKPGHWYRASTEFALRHLKGPGSCLVIGSPLQEAIALEQSWEVTYLDVRVPPHKFKNFVQADASSMPFQDDSFDAVSSACVLCHVGLGRYGDPLVEDGDEKVLGEIARVMKPGLAAVTFGGVVDAEIPVRVGNFHRIYTIKDAERMCLKAGLKIEDVGIWSTMKERWVDKPTVDERHFDYLSLLLRNVAVA